MRDGKIHWWQFPLADFSIKLKEDFKKKFFHNIYKQREKSTKLAEYINEKSELYRKPLDFRKQRALLWAHKKTSGFIPAWLVYELARFIKEDLNEIEKNIDSYISFKGTNIITKPKLPIQVTPEFASIPIHIMCDGFAYPNGKFTYCQKDEKTMNRFIPLIKNVFGEYNTNYNKKTCHTPQHYLPSIFGKIISKHYNIKTYLSSKCRIPKKLINQSRMYKIAVLAAFLLDDGNTTSTIKFYSPSKEFIIDTKKIMKDLGYNYGNIIVRNPKKPDGEKIYSIIMSHHSIYKFHNELKELFNQFPNCHIGKKFKDIEKIIQIKNRNWKQRGKGETISIILNSLKEGPKRAYELRDTANVSLWTMYHHLQHLIRIGRVEKYKNKNIIEYKIV